MHGVTSVCKNKLRKWALRPRQMLRLFVSGGRLLPGQASNVHAELKEFTGELNQPFKFHCVNQTRVSGLSLGFVSPAEVKVVAVNSLSVYNNSQLEQLLDGSVWSLWRSDISLGALLTYPNITNLYPWLTVVKTRLSQVGPVWLWTTALVRSTPGCLLALPLLLFWTKWGTRKKHLCRARCHM